MLDNTLIEKALALTWKTMEDMDETFIHHTIYHEWLTYADTNEEFSIEKFWWYLLSPEFIEKYHKRYTDYPWWNDIHDHTYSSFWRAVWFYQKWNEELLIELLSKI